MRTFDRICLKVFLYGVPLVVLFAAFCVLYEKGNLGVPGGGGVLAAVHNAGGLVLALWVPTPFVLSFRLLVSGPLRDALLTRIAGMKERDEREVQLTGRATRTTFLLTLSLLLFLLCLSCFQVSVYGISGQDAVDGKDKCITLGLRVELLNDSAAAAAAAAAQTPGRRDIFTYAALPVSVTGVILLLLVWNIGWYGFLMRRSLAGA